MSSLGGYNHRTALIDLSTGRVEYGVPAKDVLGRFIGGRGLGVKLLLDRGAGAEPLSPGSAFGIFVGPLTGTGVPLANRLTMVFKSLLTNTIAYANTGGYAGAALKLAGLDGFVFIGESSSPKLAIVRKGQVEIEDASQLWGLQSHECLMRIREKYGDARVLSIGPAGENLVKYATIVNDAGRSSGVRHGAGCLLGKKKLKSIVILSDLSHKLPINNRQAFLGVMRRMLDKIKASTLLNRENGSFSVYGTPMAVEPLNKNQALPVENYRRTHFDGAANLTGIKMTQSILITRLTCNSCPVQCRRETATLGRYDFRVEGPDYAQICALGSNCGVADLEGIAYMNFLCYELGLDPIETGNILAMYAEATERGIEGNGGLKWGDVGKMVELIRAIALRRGRGELLAEGADEVDRELGSNGLNMSVKGITIQNTDPRAEPAWGLLNATENSGASAHIWVYPDLIQSFADVGVRTLLTKETEDDPIQIAKAVKWKQDLVAVLDSLQVCAFSNMAFELQDYVDALNSVTGWSWKEEDLINTGERIFNMERYYNNCCSHNLDFVNDTLPKRFLSEPIKDGKHAVRVCVLDPMLEAYYNLRGWVKGRIPEEKARELSVAILA